MYVGKSVEKDAACMGEVKSRITTVMTEMVKLRIWRNQSISTTIKLQLMKALM